jgi:hypothetical protein
MKTENQFSTQELEDFYTHLKNLLEIIPDVVKHRYLSENNCILCKNCTEYLVSVQKQVRQDKAEKMKLIQEKEENS